MAAPAEIKTYPSYLFHMDFVQYRPLFLAHCPPPMLMPKGSRICKKGITREWMYYLYHGTLKVYTCNSHGGERLLAFLGEDSLFGLDCLAADKPSIVTIECITDAWVSPFKADLLKTIMREDPDFAYALALYYAKVMRQLCFDAESQSINDAKIRFSNFLYLYVTSNRSDTVPMSQQELSAATNCSRSSICRICNEFKSLGILRTNGRGLTVLDQTRLKAFCGF